MDALHSRVSTDQRELDNLALICSFHHELVHELGWTMSRDADGEIRWFQPGWYPLSGGAGAAGSASVHKGWELWLLAQANRVAGNESGRRRHQ